VTEVAAAEMLKASRYLVRSALAWLAEVGVVVKEPASAGGKLTWRYWVQPAQPTPR
jgi:hypothetical protein